MLPCDIDDVQCSRAVAILDSPGIWAIAPTVHGHRCLDLYSPRRPLAQQQTSLHEPPLRCEGA